MALLLHESTLHHVTEKGIYNCKFSCSNFLVSGFNITNRYISDQNHQSHRKKFANHYAVLPITKKKDSASGTDWPSDKYPIDPGLHHHRSQTATGLCSSSHLHLSNYNDQFVYMKCVVQLSYISHWSSGLEGQIV